MDGIKIAAGIISFNSMPFLEGAVASIYPYAEQILIADGPVQFWQDKGHKNSMDGTLDVNFGDKVELIQGRWAEKDEQHRAYMRHIRDDITHLWIVDPDELYRDEDIQIVLGLLGDYDVVRFKTCHFVGSLDTCVYDFNARQRILRWEPGAILETSRPPTLDTPVDRVLSGKVLARDYGIWLYHYGYVHNAQVERRSAYYEHCGIPFRFDLLADRAVPFKGTHPEWIEQEKWEL